MCIEPHFMISWVLSQVLHHCATILSPCHSFLWRWVCWLGSMSCKSPLIYIIGLLLCGPHALALHPHHHLFAWVAIKCAFNPEPEPIKWCQADQCVTSSAAAWANKWFVVPNRSRDALIGLFNFSFGQETCQVTVSFVSSSMNARKAVWKEF